jgi:hypothetical protein
VASCCECGDEPSGSYATDTVSSYLLVLSPFQHAWRSGIALLHYPGRIGFAEEKEKRLSVT